jgi:hypothetical protein
VRNSVENQVRDLQCLTGPCNLGKKIKEIEGERNKPTFPKSLHIYEEIVITYLTMNVVEIVSTFYFLILYSAQ